MVDEANVETQAREAGWVPKEEWRGPADQWRDAKEFLERGETFVPFIKADRRKLQGEVTGLRGEVSTLQTQLRAQQAALDALNEKREETARADLKTRRSTLRRQIEEARRDGNIDLVVDLQDQLDEVETRTAPARESPGPGGNGASSSSSQDPTQQPDFQNFLKDNQWFTSNAAMRGAALAIMNELVQSGQGSSMSPAERFSYVAKETRKAFGQAQDDTRPNGDKVMGAHQGGGSGSSSSGSSPPGQSYADLPADARSVAERMAAKFVGPGKKYPDMKTWQAAYAEKYFNPRDPRSMGIV